MIFVCLVVYLDPPYGLHPVLSGFLDHEGLDIKDPSLPRLWAKLYRVFFDLEEEECVF